MDLPFLLPQSRILRASNLTPDLKMRYGADIHLVSAILGENLIVGFPQYIWVADVSQICAKY